MNFYNRIKTVQLPVMGRKLQIRLLYLELILIALGIGLIAFWYFVPVNVLEIKKLPIPVTPPENIKAGRIIILSFDYCKYKDLEGDVQRQLISERLVLDMPPYQETMKKGCGLAQSPIILPYTVATQKFYIHYRITYQVNPVRQEVVEFDTAQFEVQPAPVLVETDAESNQNIVTGQQPKIAFTIPTVQPTPFVPQRTIVNIQPQTVSAQEKTSGESAKTDPAPVQAPQPTATPVPAQPQQPTPTPIIQTVLNTVRGILNL